MSKIKLTGHASGSGVLTIAAPNTDSDRTITLPDVTGTLLDSGSDLPAANLTGTVADARISTLTASKLTGDLPAISGASLTGLPNGSQLDYSGTKTIEATSGGALIGGTAGAKNITVESTSGAGTISLIQLKNSSDSFNIEVGRTVGALTIRDNNNGERLKLDSTGAVTMPSQPAFSVGMVSHQTAIALYGERKAEFDSERFDQNADFNTTTHEFTAPVTGRYQLSFVCYLEPMQGDANFYGFHINTSNKSHFYYDLGRGTNFDHSGGGAMSVLADMDAGDTAFCAVYQHAGAANTKIMNYSTFSGFLAC